VLYDPEECHALLSRHIQQILDAYKAFPVGPADAGDALGIVVNALFRAAAYYAIRFKRSNFSDEKELRYVALVAASDRPRVHRLKATVRDRSFLPLRLRKPRRHFAFSEIILDPRVADVEAQAQRVMNLLRSVGHPDVEMPPIRPSTCALVD
jgi:hypothetical protein